MDGKTIADVLVSESYHHSRDRDWRAIEFVRAQIGERALRVDGLASHTIALNLGRPYRLTGTIEGRRDTVTMAPGTLKIVTAQVRSAWEWDRGEPLDILHVSVPGRVIARELAEAELPGATVRSIVGVDDPELRRLAHALYRYGSPTSPAGALQADAIGYAIATELIERYLTAPIAVGHRSHPLDARTLRRLDEYIAASMDRVITLSSLAEIAGISRFHFARRFRATVGTSVLQYVLERRLTRARRLTLETQLSLPEVAQMCGFTDQSHLTRHMRRRFNRTPGALRKDRARTYKTGP